MKVKAFKFKRKVKMNISKKIVSLEGGSGFGKSTIAHALAKENDVLVYESITHDIYSRISKENVNIGEEFSNMFFNIRVKQYLESKQDNIHQVVLFDRFLFFPIAMRIFAGIPVPHFYYDVLQKQCSVDEVFVFEPIPLSEYPNGWPRESITYDESMKLNAITLKLAQDLSFKVSYIPFGSVSERVKNIKEIIL